MNLIRLRFSTLLLCCLLILSTSFAAFSQQRRTQSRPQPKQAAPTSSNVSFDSLISTECYKIYGEVRGVGQVVRSNTINQLLEPILNISGPPKEFRSLVKWLNTNADEVMSSRMFVGAWRTAPDVPDVLVALEFPSVDEAVKFEPKLNSFLPKLLPPTPVETPVSVTEGAKAEANPTKTGNDSVKEPPPVEKPKQDGPAKPNFYVKQLGTLVLITSTPVNLKKLRPAGSKLLSDDPHFKTARNRFTSEPVFIFIDMKSIEKEDEDRRKAYAAEIEQEQTIRPPAAVAEAAKTSSVEKDAVPQPVEVETEPSLPPEPMVVDAPQETHTSDGLAAAFSIFGSTMGGAKTNWPDAISIALSFENDSIDLRGLFLNSPGQKIDPIPFLPVLSAGPPLVPEAPSILPANTEMFVMASLDLLQIHGYLSAPPAPGMFIESKGTLREAKEVIRESPIAALERQLKVNIKDELLPLLGSEVVLSLPASEMGFFGLKPMDTVPESDPTSDESKETQKPKKPEKQPVIAISIRDREGMKRFLPKIIESFGFKGASALAQVERRDDTELVTYANALAYAFIGNFLVVSPDIESVKGFVDSYLKHETLASSASFKDATRWQSRQVQSSAYMSSYLMESLKSWSTGRTATVNEKAKELFDRLGLTPQPITYSLTNEGVGVLHELHIPKDLILMAVASISSEANPPEEIANERKARGTLYGLIGAQAEYKEKHGNYTSLEQLLAENEWLKTTFDDSKYRFEMVVSGDKYEITAVPVEYGKSGRMSFFVNETGLVRGADHAGGPATAADKPATYQ